MTRVTSARQHRAGHQPAGGLAVRARKTVAAPAPAVFAAWADARRRARWLAGVKLIVRRKTAPTALCLTCTDDDSDIAVSITARGPAKCALVVDHTRLANAQMVAERRHCWKEMLRALKEYLEDKG
jgi:hypothetical protein